MMRFKIGDKVEILNHKEWPISWHNGKSSQSGDDIIACKPSTSNCFREANIRSNRAQKHPTAVQGNTPVVSIRSLKRPPSCSFLVFQAFNGPAQKLRATEKKGPKQQAKVEKSMHPPSNIISHRFTERRKNHILGFSSFKSSDLNTTDTDTCSVGSCSIIANSLENPHGNFLSTNYREKKMLVSDAESSHGPGSGTKKILSHPQEVDLEVSVRELELQAYRSTLGALYASGPLSWEQEAMLTNLRIMLHISNDEHLKELKHLISSNMPVSVRSG